MSAAFLGALATAGALGVTHAIEPDHLAGISSLTSECRDARLPALVGACFSAGHVVLVVLWLAVAEVVLGSTEFPPVLETVGTLSVAVLLGALGSVMTVQGLRSARVAHNPSRAQDHDHLGHSHSRSGLVGPTTAPEDARARTYLRTGVIGALFTLSPPVSMIAFVSTLLSVYDGSVVTVAVAAYAVGIVATMSLIGAGVGVLFDRVGDIGHAASVFRTLAGLAVIGVAGWTLAGLP